MKTLTQLSQEENTYRPSQEVQDQLANVVLICVVGGTATGKSFLMKQSGLPTVGRVTSRPRREDDDPNIYTYLSTAKLTEMIEARKLVQYAIDKRSGVIYGSMPDDYVTGTPMVADIWHWSVKPMGDKGFGVTRAVSVVTPPEQWRQQLEERFMKRDTTYRTSRLAEARDSLEWTRAQLISQNPSHALIINDKNDTARSVKALRDFAWGKKVDEPIRALEFIDKLIDFITQF